MSGFNMPPGVSPKDIPGNSSDERCDVCTLDASECICPECPVCHEAGSPNCYKEHGLIFGQHEFLETVRDKNRCHLCLKHKKDPIHKEAV